VIYKYEWAKGSPYGNADAQRIGEEITSIGRNPSTKQILDKARNENSAMHNLIEWDDAIAAEKYREKQAQKIVINLVVREVPNASGGEPKKVDVPVRAFVSTGNNDRTYTPIHYVVSDASAYSELLKRALDELNSFKRKYQTLSELSEIFALIENIGN
jgi:hypothetical protein